MNSGRIQAGGGGPAVTFLPVAALFRSTYTVAGECATRVEALSPTGNTAHGGDSFYSSVLSSDRSSQTNRAELSRPAHGAGVIASGNLRWQERPRPTYSLSGTDGRVKIHLKRPRCCSSATWPINWSAKMSPPGNWGFCPRKD